MKVTRKLRLLFGLSIVASVALLGTTSSFGVVVTFEWTQTDPDPNTGSGTISATWLGVPYSAPMPVPTFIQYESLLAGESLPAGAIGFTNHTEDNQGNPPDGEYGFHLGWSGTVTLFDALLNEFVVDLQYEPGDQRVWEATWFDVPATGDIVAEVIRIAGWVGDDQDGHRHSGDNNKSFAIGPDSYTTLEIGNVGSNGRNGDNVGIRFAVRDHTFIIDFDEVTGEPITQNDDDGEALPASVYFKDITFGGTLFQIPEPSTFALLGLGLGGLLIRKRRK